MKVPYQEIGATLAATIFGGIAILGWGATLPVTVPFAAMVFVGTWIALKQAQQKVEQARFLEKFERESRAKIADIKQRAQKDKTSCGTLLLETMSLAENILSEIHNYPSYYDSNCSQLGHLLEITEFFLGKYERASRNKSTRNQERTLQSATRMLGELKAAFEEAYANLGSNDVVGLESFERVLRAELASEGLTSENGFDLPMKEEVR